ncbi:hypothetical protein I7I53_02258 [Histoplasma capsulatum var. duboisii H88]|uniref:Uncharacterized protein n=1 Tax=Ajellomyces capsulatus (strain H88) TaxID=544711 RepID=A0A8A1LL36_AJEC8|nr:hypothetical protein I7I53_02258 [Histoplasma capsulatum var. duboisii H88]
MEVLTRSICDVPLLLLQGGGMVELERGRYRVYSWTRKQGTPQVWGKDWSAWLQYLSAHLCKSFLNIYLLLCRVLHNSNFDFLPSIFRASFVM